MPNIQVKLHYKVTGATLGLDLEIQGGTYATQVNNGIYEDDVSGHISPGETMKIKFTVKAITSSKYTIEYKCTGDGKEQKDPAKPSPIQGTVLGGNAEAETINIKFPNQNETANN